MIRIFLVLLFLSGCADYMPIHDPYGSQANNFYGDLQECRFTAQMQMSGFEYGYHEEEVIKTCMENRKYSILK
tara:strand:+ start:87 stop:305 length:219 start_codon:yes stop_codon:yes gene_type:complete